MTLIEMDFFPSNFMFQTPPQPHESDHQHQHHHQEVPTSLSQVVIPSCSSQDFHGVASLLGKRSPMTFSGVDMYEDTTTHGGEDEFSDDGSQVNEKKRRLNMEQVKTLEKNFELGNKLEPERKMQLARALGLQPRQIAIWFQNRRARWKTKQLEKDYDVLKRQFDVVKAENDALQAQNHKLQAEIMAIKNKEPTESINLNIIKETEGSSSNRSDDENSSDNIKLDISRTPLPIKPTSGLAQFQFQKIDQIAKEESLINNMLCNIDEQTAFWPWLEPQNFN
ncbi:hypothetical protein Leryth_015791 [Lithospermum erythrorhizon]|nr:hypothetical protein Leryth_015791 [Lithospermum erythrorhizon]